MKNFRKVLALILVVATLFSFVAMASARTPGDYADYSEVKYKEAVDIMTALGINEGYDGKFHPADTIDRDEVAAMIARLRNGGKFDAALYVGADNVFADVKGQWSEGYVTYCAQLGIINGLNETTFNPDGKITVVDTLKLLLCVLGYDAKLQGYVGPNYKVAVVRDAEKMGLTAGIASADMFKEATRDQVALMFFNALQARLVYGYVSENIVTLTNSLVKDIPWISVPDIADAKTELAYNNAVISMWTLGDILGVSSDDAVDCYGRPGTVWTVGSWSKFYKDAPVNATVNGADPKPANTAVVDVYVNGVKLGGEQRAAADYSALLGKGVVAEAYAVEGGVRIVLIDTFFGVVTATSARYGTAVIDDALEVKDASLKVGDVVAYTVCDGTCGTKLADALTCGDHLSGGAIHSYAVVTPVTVKVDETHRVVANADNSYILTDKGEKYEYAFNRAHELAPTDYVAEDDIMSWTAKGKSVDLYLANGYIQYWCATPVAGAGASYDVAYFVEGSNKFTTVHAGGTDVALDSHTYAATADVVKMDATMVKDMPITIDDKAAAEGALEDTYTIMLNRPQNMQGTMWDGILAQYNTANGQMTKVANVADQNAWLNSFTGELVGEKAANGLNYHFTAETRFLVRTWDIATGAPTYTAVTGYKAMPEYLGKLVFGDQKYFNTIQYLATDDGYITDLYIDAFYAKTSAETIYVLSKEEEIGVAGLGQYFTEIEYYKAYVNGAVSYVVYFNVNAQDVADTDWTAGLEAGKLYTTTVKAINGTYNDLPIYVAMTESTMPFFAVAGQYDDVVVKNGQIELWADEAVKDIVASNYLADLTVYVMTNVTDGTVVAGIYTGTDFVAKYQGSEFFVDTAENVYGIGNPVNTLVLWIK